MTPLKYNCTNCNSEFIKKDTRNVATAKHLFCCRKCLFEYKNKYRKMVKVVCRTCGNTFTKRISECKKYPNHYCSAQCRGNRNLSENVIFCEVCKKGINRPPSSRKRMHGKHAFCSKKCESAGKDTRVIKTCPVCKTSFKESKCGQQFCSVKCRGDSHRNKRPVKCIYCNVEILRTPYQLKKAKHTFCSTSCCGKYYSWKNNRRRQSKAEVKLASMIRQEFPSIDIHQNTRDVLNCHLEIDIWIPSIKLAIELNGPCHFINIYGNKIFSATLKNDSIKKKEILERGFNLLIINVNQPDKVVRPLIEEQYENVIKPMLLSSGT